ncbi:MAG: GNAT family N-acetyltransferase [Panacagrimonas sp.]
MKLIRVKGFPKTRVINQRKVELRLMTAEDAPRILKFARALPPHDLLFLRRDITQEKNVDLWVEETAVGTTYTLLAVEGEVMIGYGSLIRSQQDWSRHVAEIRVLTAESARGLGLGQLLTREAFQIALELGVEKISARMTLDQAGARRVFESMGFRPEAVLHDEVKDKSGKKHDLLVMANDVQAFLARMDQHGIPG